MKNQEGITIIELMIIVSIIGILAAVAIPKFADMLFCAKCKQYGSFYWKSSSYLSNHSKKNALEEAQLFDSMIQRGGKEYAMKEMLKCAEEDNDQIEKMDKEEFDDYFNNKDTVTW